MVETLQDLSPARLITAIEQNLSSWIPIFGLTGVTRSDDPPGVKRSISPVPMALFNSIMDARLTPENADAAIQAVKADADIRQVGVMWWVGPSTRPADLGKRLEASGFVFDDDSPGMVVELSKLPENLDVPEGLSIQRVDSADDLREWCAAMAAGLEIPAARVDLTLDTWSKLLQLVNREVTQTFLARLNGQPVATSLLQLAAGVAGIFSVATIPDARRKGIGAQVTLYPLLQARAMGYKAGVLGASEMGVGVYRSLGFQEYCRITSYVYQPKPR